MVDLTSKTFYELLGVSPTASAQEIKDAYKQIARAYHPDSNFYDEILESHAGGGAEPQPTEDSEVFKRITEAYNTLVSEERRREYDQLFPKGLRDWDDIERNVQEDLVGSRAMQSSSTLYRPRGDTGAFKRSQFGKIDPVNEPSIDQAVRGHSIRPMELPKQRNILPWFLGLLLVGFLAGAALAYYLVTHR